MSDVATGCFCGSLRRAEGISHSSVHLSPSAHASRYRPRTAGAVCYALANRGYNPASSPCRRNGPAPNRHSKAHGNPWPDSYPAAFSARYSTCRRYGPTSHHHSAAHGDPCPDTYPFAHAHRYSAPNAHSPTAAYPDSQPYAHSPDHAPTPISP